MASGGWLTDLILRCLVFWFCFRCSSFEEGISTVFDGSEYTQKRSTERAGLSTAFKSRALEGRDTMELQGIESSYRLSY